MKSITVAVPYPSTFILKLSLAFAGALLVALVLPQQLFAYDTTEQSAIQLTEDTVLFQVTYRFNFANRDSEHPLLTARAATATADFTDRVQYDIIDAAGSSLAVGDVAAVVLSETPVLETRQYLQTDEAIFATLVALVKLTPEQVASGGSAALKLNWLPFTLINGDERINARVPQPELDAFVTPAITWQPAPGAVTAPAVTPAEPTVWK